MAYIEPIEVIKLGNVRVCIFAQDHREGYTVPHAKPNFNSIPGVSWEDAFTSSPDESVVGYGTGGPDGNSVGARITASVTNCHGLDVNIGTPYQTVPGQVSAYMTDISFTKEGTDPPQALDTTATAAICNPPPITSNAINRISKWVGMRYNFVDDQTPGSTKQYGYIIFTVECDTRTSGGSKSYNKTGRFHIDIPYINYQNNSNYYLDPAIPPDPDDPNDEDDPSGPDGGDGDHTIIYDPVPIPDKPTMGSANAGFVTMYKLGLAAINMFASDMFADSVWDAVKLFFGNPMDFLVGCMLLPFEPHTGSSYRPKFGLVTFEHAYPAVDEQYKDIDCGTIQVNKYWGSCFDYEPYTKIQIWLPYIGYRDLPVDEIMGMSLNVKYRVDCLTGDCIAFISTGTNGATGPEIPRVIAQYYGNCGVRIPFGSVSFDSAVAASINLIGAAASVGLSSGNGGMVSGNEGGKAVDEGFSSPSSAGLVNATIGVVSGLKPNVQKGGAAGASSGYMSVQKPYLIRRIPRQNLPHDFRSLKGYPANISGKLSNFSGLAVVDDIQLNDIPAMETERREIMQWLTGGVLI